MRRRGGEVDEVLLIELHRAGSLPKARMRGMSTGIAEVIRLTERCRTVSIDGDGQFQTALERVRKHGDLYAGVLTTKQRLTDALKTLGA